MTYYTERYLAMMGKAPKRIPHWEPLSNPSFVEYVTGIDPWEKPRTAMLSLLDQYYIDFGVQLPVDDTPIKRPDMDADGTIRWGQETTTFMEAHTGTMSIEEVLRYDPIEHFDDHVLSEDEFYGKHYANTSSSSLQAPRLGMPDYKNVHVVDVGLIYFYETLFMRPLMTFGWDLFLQLVGGHPNEAKRIMDGFAAISRRHFRSIANMPQHINVVLCHDDICMTSGPVCSPAWLRECVYPYYEEFFTMLKNAGKRVIFNSDGNIDKVADDIVACGADGFASEPATDWKTLARKYPEHTLFGEGDNRVLMGGDSEAIKNMVDNMVENANLCGGYLMCIGNHIPWNVPPENVKLYFDYCKERAYRK